MCNIFHIVFYILMPQTWRFLLKLSNFWKKCGIFCSFLQINPEFLLFVFLTDCFNTNISLPNMCSKYTESVTGTVQNPIPGQKILCKLSNCEEKKWKKALHSKLSKYVFCALRIDWPLLICQNVLVSARKYTTWKVGSQMIQLKNQ